MEILIDQLSVEDDLLIADMGAELVVLMLDEHLLGSSTKRLIASTLEKRRDILED